MKVFTKTGKCVLGVCYPANICIDVPESQARFLIDKEGFEEFKGKRNSHKKIIGGKK